ncbi:hypothetical protein F4861DRAFT_533058 [Xylaria intraflava]|nr:hypothetical protein F4861DRAFT_533058 [Xylaria intraflava]
MHARSFFVHPYARTREGYNTPTEEQRRRRRQHAPEVTPRVNNSDTTVGRGPSDPAMRRMMADMKLSLAASQLSEQVKEGTRFWREFQNEYSVEVNSIKFYAGGDVLQQIWRKKVEYNHLCKGGDKDDDQSFDIQIMKLESCLNEVDEATRLLAQAWSSDCGGDYNSRHHYLEKLRRSGNFAVGLSKNSRENEMACRDLLDELAELEKLLDPRTSASMLHRFKKRPTQNTTRSGEQKHEGQSSDRSEHGDANQQTEHGSHDWQANDEQDSSNTWLGNND